MKLRKTVSLEKNVWADLEKIAQDGGYPTVHALITEVLDETVLDAIMGTKRKFNGYRHNE